MSVWSYLRQYMYTKWDILLDHTFYARDWKQVVWAISTKMDPARDITLVESTPIDYLDFASPEDGLGSKIGLDATDKWPPEPKRDWGREIRMDQAVIDRTARLSPEHGLPARTPATWTSAPTHPPPLTPSRHH